MGNKFELTCTPPSELSVQNKSFTVGSLESALLKEFPAHDGEEWDITGLTVGERGLSVSKVAIALDVTVEAIKRAKKLDADVLLTHHPPYLKGPIRFSPAASDAISEGAFVWEAIRSHVALMNFHTALDISKRAQVALPNLLGFDFTGKLLVEKDDNKSKGYGQICNISSADGSSMSLSQLSAKCLSVFGKAPRVWGSPNKKVRTCATALGSSGNVLQRALDLNIDCLICGEIGYHSALSYSKAGLAIIELGHDVSELPLVAVLAGTLCDIGFNVDDIVMIDQSDNWRLPEAIRL